MTLSVFDLFKVGIGPSSSHTVGPMRAANTFIQTLQNKQLLSQATSIRVDLYGSLSATGRGHATDRATVMGLMGEEPEEIDVEAANKRLQQCIVSKKLELAGKHTIDFDFNKNIVFHPEFLSYHPNAMTLTASDNEEVLLNQTYYSVGGGFIIEEEQIKQQDAKSLSEHTSEGVPYPFSSAKELLELCQKHQLRISELMMANEKTWRSEEEVKAKLLHIWHIMQSCVQKGMHQTGELPGGLGVKRRAAEQLKSLQELKPANVISSTLNALGWVNLFAFAVGEENAAGGKIVTAPTNGAAGVVPAVLHYFMMFTHNASDEDVINFLLSAAAIGILCKLNASISGAEVGCQGEIGSACAMAAAGLAEVMNATPEQLENAAEIALEHNLGLTCDPIAGLVQVPCIERNAIAAVKAINAVQLALKGSGSHFVSLDHAIRTMKETGMDMSAKYKETSQGGLATVIDWC